MDYGYGETNTTTVVPFCSSLLSFYSYSAVIVKNWHLYLRQDWLEVLWSSVFVGSFVPDARDFSKCESPIFVKCGTDFQHLHKI